MDDRNRSTEWNALVADNVAQAADTTIRSLQRGVFAGMRALGLAGYRWALPRISSSPYFEICMVDICMKSKSCRFLITFRVSRRPREMYCGHARLCVCLCVCLSVRGRMFTLFTEPDVTWGSGRSCPLVVHYWADLQSVHGLRCYGTTMEMRGRAQRQSAGPTARRTHAAMPAKTPLAGDKIDAPAACAQRRSISSILRGCCKVNAKR